MKFEQFFSQLADLFFSKLPKFGNLNKRKKTWEETHPYP